MKDSSIENRPRKVLEDSQVRRREQGRARKSVTARHAAARPLLLASNNQNTISKNPSSTLTVTLTMLCLPLQSAIPWGQALLPLPSQSQAP